MKPITNALDPAVKMAANAIELRDLFAQTPKAKALEVYNPSKHNAAAPQRKGSDNAMRLPSRVNNKLIYRDGREDEIQR